MLRSPGSRFRAATNRVVGNIDDDRYTPRSCRLASSSVADTMRAISSCCSTHTGSTDRASLSIQVHHLAPIRPYGPTGRPLVDDKHVVVTKG